MTNEIKIISSTTVVENKGKVVENKGNLEDFKEKKGDFNNKKNFEQILHQLKLLMHKGKLVAESGNPEFPKVDETNNPEDFMNLIEKSNTNVSEPDEQLLAKFENLPIKEIVSKLELDAIDIGLNTQVITDNNQKIDKTQILSYAKKMGLNQNAIELLFKNNGNSKSKNFSKMQLLASIRNIAISNSADRQEKLHIQPTALTKIKAHLQTDELSEKLQIKIDDLKRNVLGNNSKLSLQTESPAKEKSSEKWFSLEKKEYFEAEGQDELDFEKSREKLLKNFGSKLNKEENKGKAYDIDLEDDMRIFIRSVKVATNNQVITTSQVETTNSNSNLSFSSEGISTTHLSNDLGSQNQNSSKDNGSDSIDLKRYEQYLKLSEKLAENVAKRIIQQIKRGEWKINLSLKPKTLGSIEIELTLKGKQLEASFNVNQLLTRELLQDGLPRLRDSLEKSGIDVANLDINHKKQDGKDEKPTNRKNYEIVEQNNSRDTSLSGPKVSSEHFIISAHELNVLV